MAITSNSAVNFVLYTKDDFKTAGASSYASTGDIVFVEKENSIYLNGTYYGLSAEDKKAITDAISKVGDFTSITTTLIGIVNNLRHSIDGQNIADGSPEGTPQIWNKTGVLENADNIVDAIEALASKIDELSNGNFLLQGTATNTDIQSGSISISTVQDIVDTIGKVIGTGDSWQSGEQKTLSKLRDLIKANTDAINTLSGNEDGMNLTDILSKITAIENELKSDDGTLTTLIDGLKVFLSGNLTTTGATFKVDGTDYTTLKDILDALVNKIKAAQDTADNAVTNATEAAKSEIGNLDATVRGNLETNDSVSSGKHVGVKVVETDGLLTEVLVVEDDIASAKTVNELSQTVSTLEQRVNDNVLKWTVIS